jgi:hypothetical protein
VINTEEKILKSYNKVLRGILIGNAMVKSSGEQKNEFMKNVMLSVGALYYLVNEKEAN